MAHQVDRMLDLFDKSSARAELHAKARCGCRFDHRQLLLDGGRRVRAREPRGEVSFDGPGALAGDVVEKLTMVLGSEVVPQKHHAGETDVPPLETLQDRRVSS